jgi:hypothetical protein
MGLREFGATLKIDCHAPGQEFFYSTEGMIGELAEHFAQPAFLRDLVRAREAAKQDQMRARHRLSKFFLRSGQRPPTGVRPWTRPYLIWGAQLRFTQIAQEATREDYRKRLVFTRLPHGK